MKHEHPGVIDIARQMLPTGGVWSALESSKGKVIIQHCNGAAQQAAEVVRQIKFILQQQPHCSLEQIAILARNGIDKNELVWVRSALADAEIPCRFSLDKNYGFPVRYCREIEYFLDWLRQQGLTPLTPDELRQILPSQEESNRWHNIIHDLIEQWELSQGNEPLPAAYFDHFIQEYLSSQRRQVRFGNGVLLSTVHGVKGEEFEHVIILDGGWQNVLEQKPEIVEEERRLFYVGMTRAISRLVIMCDDKLHNPHLALLNNDFVYHQYSQAVAPDMLRRFSILGLRQMFISFAGAYSASAPIHSALNDVQVGDAVSLVASENAIKVVHKQKNIAQLSKTGREQWLSSLAHIKRVEVLAVILRSKEHTSEEYQGSLKVDHWQLPVLLVETHGNTNSPHF